MFKNISKIEKQLILKMSQNSKFQLFFQIFFVFLIIEYLLVLFTYYK